jgi:DNA transposition AAA+ family ATPase
MRVKTTITKNIKAYLVAMGAQEERSLNVEGMSLLRGRPGEGKTWGTAFVCNRVNGVHVRALRTWSISSMLAAMVNELGGKPSRFINPMFEFVVKQLKVTRRSLFIDEADYLNEAMIDVVRDIYDLSRRPVVMIGMDDITRSLANNERFMRRITQDIPFKPLDINDTRLVCDDKCEVGVADDLLARLHTESGGNIGLVTNGLAAIERHAKSSNIDSVDLEGWGKRRLFFDSRSV